MSNHQEIEKVFKKYLTALYSNDHKTLYSLLNIKELEKYRVIITEFTYQMDEFGESQEFLDRLNFASVQDLKNSSLFDFISAIFKLVSLEIEPKYLLKIINELIISNIEEKGELSVISYQYPIKIFNDWDLKKGNVEMVLSANEWKINFKSGLEVGLKRFKEEIDSYYEKKSKDNLDNFEFEGDLISYSTYGYKNFTSGKTVFEPRFKDAGDFCEGLAYVQIMRKYGYLDSKGNLAIKPRFFKARDFSKNRAAVLKEISPGITYWGFINKKGQEKIAFEFDETSDFSEGLCAVRKNNKWGFITKKGELRIPFQFEGATDFSFGTAEVIVTSKKGNPKKFIVNKKGILKKVN